MEKRKNQPSFENKSLSGCMAVIAASTIFVGLYFIALIINAILSPPRCIPPESGYTPEIPIPSQAVLIEARRHGNGVYTIHNFNQMELVEFFESELDAFCYREEGNSKFVTCFGELERLTRFYIYIRDTNLESQSTDFTVSFVITWCLDEWPE